MNSKKYFFECGELSFRQYERTETALVYGVVHNLGEDLKWARMTLQFLERRYEIYRQNRLCLAEEPKRFDRFFPRFVEQKADCESQRELLVEVVSDSGEDDRIIPLTDILDADVKLGAEDLVELALQMFNLMMFVHMVDLCLSFRLENFGLVVSERRIVWLNWLEVSVGINILDEKLVEKQICEAAHNLLLLGRAELRLGRWEIKNLHSELELKIIETLLAGTQGIFPTATEIYRHLCGVRTLL